MVGGMKQWPMIVHKALTESTRPRRRLNTNVLIARKAFEVRKECSRGKKRLPIQVKIADYRRSAKCDNDPSSHVLANWALVVLAVGKTRQLSNNDTNNQHIDYEII